jgi:hypothetical protein
MGYVVMMTIGVPQSGCLLGYDIFYGCMRLRMQSLVVAMHMQLCHLLILSVH